VSSKKKETSKLTKHGFLDKIKAAAKTKGSEGQNDSEIVKDSSKGPDENGGTNRSSWGALRDDFMFASKKVSECIAIIVDRGLILKTIRWQYLHDEVSNKYLKTFKNWDEDSSEEEESLSESELSRSKAAKGMEGRSRGKSDVSLAISELK